jgi:hypothetical protein
VAIGIGDFGRELRPLASESRCEGVWAVHLAEVWHDRSRYAPIAAMSGLTPNRLQERNASKKILSRYARTQRLRVDANLAVIWDGGRSAGCIVPRLNHFSSKRLETPASPRWRFSFVRTRVSPDFREKR